MMAAAASANCDIVRRAFARASSRKIDAAYLEAALVAAAVSGSTCIVDFMLSRGVPVDAAAIGKQTESGMNISPIFELQEPRITPLLAAAARGKSSVVQILLDRGADLNERSFDGDTPLSLAVLSGNASTVALLASRAADVDQRVRGAWTPLMLAVKAGHTEIVRSLLKAGADPRLGNDEGDDSFSLAQKRGSAELAALLAEFSSTNGHD
jgi:hypothetical protein